MCWSVLKTNSGHHNQPDGMSADFHNIALQKIIVIAIKRSLLNSALYSIENWTARPCFASNEKQCTEAWTSHEVGLFSSFK